jgi:hypothetical protein
MGISTNVASDAVFAIRDIDEDTPKFTKGRVIGTTKYGSGENERTMYKVVFENYPDFEALVEVRGDIAYMADLDRPFEQVVEAGNWSGGRRAKQKPNQPAMFV